MLKKNIALIYLFALSCGVGIPLKANPLEELRNWFYTQKIETVDLDSGGTRKSLKSVLDKRKVAGASLSLAASALLLVLAIDYREELKKLVSSDKNDNENEPEKESKEKSE